MSASLRADADLENVQNMTMIQVLKKAAQDLSEHDCCTPRTIVIIFML